MTEPTGDDYRAVIDDMNSTYADRLDRIRRTDSHGLTVAQAEAAVRQANDEMRVLSDMTARVEAAARKRQADTPQPPEDYTAQLYRLMDQHVRKVWEAGYGVGVRHGTEAGTAALRDAAYRDGFTDCGKRVLDFLGQLDPEETR